MFKTYLKSITFLFLLLAMQRFLFLSLSYDLWKSASVSDILFCLMAGARFDLMVTGYALIPALILLLPPLEKILAKISLFRPIYKLLIEILVLYLVIIEFFDLEWVHIYGDRFNSAHTANEFVERVPIDGFLLFNLILSLAIFIFCVFSILRWRIHKPTSDRMRVWLAMLILAAIMIRGSFGEYHLDLRHSKVTGNEFLNNAAISSAYALDQAIKSRR